MYGIGSVCVRDFCFLFFVLFDGLSGSTRERQKVRFREEDNVFSRVVFVGLVSLATIFFFVCWIGRRGRGERDVYMQCACVVKHHTLLFIFFYHNFFPFLRARERERERTKYTSKHKRRLINAGDASGRNLKVLSHPTITRSTCM